MRLDRLPISRCHVNCIKCGMPMEFRVFESGAGGDFSTYLGQNTNSVYRVNLGKIHHLGKSLDQLLLPAVEREGGIENLASIPDQIRCKVCGMTFQAEHYMLDGEEIIDAYDL